MCYLSKNYNELSSAGNKAKTDIEKIMQQQGFRNVGLKQSCSSNKLLGFLLTLAGVLKTPFSLRKGDMLVLQYPLKKYYLLACRIARLRGCKTVTVIHDLGSFRRKRLTAEKEIKRLRFSDHIIAHNSCMKRWLEERGCKQSIGCLEIFDYLSSTSASPREFPRQHTILYAGALSYRKNPFLYDWEEHMHNYRLNLYGNGFDIEQFKRGGKQISYKGFVASDLLIASAEGSFGLVWDGTSIDLCSGDFGEYLQYNNPHKTSLYIRCQLPIIIWEKAALASFVKENGIGICVGSLHEIEERFARMEAGEYREMVENIEVINQRLSQGYYFRKAIGEAQKTLA